MFSAATDKKIALFIADGCEEIEALTVADIAYRAGIPCTKVSVSDSLKVTSSHDVTVMPDITAADLPFEEYDMLVLPGGMPGTLNLRDSEILREKLLLFAKEGRQIAAICAAPSILASLGILKGVRAACNPSVEDALEEGGAFLVREPAVVSGNIITSRGMGTAVPFALAIMAHYLGKEKAEELRKTILFGT